MIYMHHMKLFRPATSVLAVLTLLLAQAALGQAAGLTVSGSSRLRNELIEGQARSGYNQNDQLINLRTNILAEYRASRARFGVELYDSRVWGDDSSTPVTSNEVNALEPVQAYVAVDLADVFGRGSKLSLSAGRMTLNLGSRRLVAADDYRNTTNGYTGLRADIALSNGWKSSLIYTLPQLRLPDDLQGLRSAEVQLDKESPDLVLFGGQVSRAGTLGDATAELTYFRLNEDDAAGRPTRDRRLDTYGARLFVEPKPSRIDYEVEALLQSGHVSASLSPAAATQAVRASFLHADVGYTFAHAWQPRLSVELDRASGDKPGGKNSRFDTLFGMRRAELAPSGLFNAVGRANILTPGLRFEATPGKRTDWFAVYRAMWLAEDEDSFSTTGVRDASGLAGDFAGHLIEGRVRHWVVPARLRFELDALLMSKGRFQREAPNATPARWTAYGSLNLTASF